MLKYMLFSSFEISQFLIPKWVGWFFLPSTNAQQCIQLYHTLNHSYLGIDKSDGLMLERVKILLFGSSQGQPHYNGLLDGLWNLKHNSSHFPRQIYFSMKLIMKLRLMFPSLVEFLMNDDYVHKYVFKWSWTFNANCSSLC